MTIRVAALAVALLSPSPAGADSFVLTIAASEGRPGEARLEHAEHDAAMVASTFARVGQVAPGGSVVLRSPRPAAVEAALTTLGAAIEARQRQGSRGDTLIVYYSGHADDEGMHLGRATLTFAELRAWLERSPARMRLLLLDACRSGGALRRKGATPTEPFAVRLDEGADMKGTAVVTSSTEFEASFESERLGGSVFTHHWVQGLLGAADIDRDLRVTLHEAYGYAYQQTVKATGLLAERQRPAYDYDLAGRGEFVLGRLAGMARFRIDEVGAYLFFDARDRLVAELAVTAPSTPYAAPSGRYTVLHRSGAEARSFEVELKPGVEETLRAIDARPIPPAAWTSRAKGLRPVHQLGLAATLGAPLLAGYGPSLGLVVGWRIGLDPWWFGVDARVTAAQLSGVEPDRELGLRLRAEWRYELEWASLGPGLLLDGAWVHQSRDFGERSSLALGTGLLVGLEVPIHRGLALRLEGGPMARLARVATSEREVGRFALSPGYWSSAGVTWTF
jgi:hypothetical protein